ncbi:extracellular solute-binding protein [Paenibacillus periandrae]|uniref:extracellular solute-binding protein n=1 Tax=Paenibacillus periandrae TaxID=1761741 RepID=UPI001F0A02F9|nr:extracellular solute-binding protein [Paenibacillus periandrae]
MSWTKCSLVTLCSLLLLTACSGNSEGGNLKDKEASDTGVKKPLKMSMAWPLYNELPDMNNAYWTEFKKRANVDLDVQWIPSANYQQKLELMIATGDIPEVVQGLGLNIPSFYKAIENDYFWDLTPFLGDFSKYPNLKKNAELGVFDSTKINGKIYSIPRMRSQVQNSIHMRKDWLDKLNIPVPTTLEEYKEALKKIVKANPNGQGTIGISGWGVLMKDLDVPFMPAFGVYELTFDSGGGLIKEVLTPQYADMVEWFRGLYSDGVLPKEFPTLKDKPAEDLFASGKAASYGRVINRDWTYTETNRKIDPSAMVQSLVLKGPKGYAINLRQPYAAGMYISKKVPESKVREILDYNERTATKAFLQLGEYGIEGVHYNMVDGYPKMTETGFKEMVLSSYDLIPAVYDVGFKIRNPNAPAQFNKDTEVLAKEYMEKGKVNPFATLISSTWSETWPKYSDEYDTKIVQAVVGAITMEQFREHQASLRNKPDMKKAFQEFAQNEKDIRQSLGK